MGGAIPEMDRRFEIPGTAVFAVGNGGLPKIRITTGEAVGESYLHGAHITSWKPAGRDEVLFLSSQSRWEDGHAIRGGVPICFPWFGDKADDPKAPASRGFVRTKAWQLESITVGWRRGDGEYVHRKQCRRYQAMVARRNSRLAYHVTPGSELETSGLEATNTGKTSMRFEEALHAYHRVENIRKVRVSGLDTIHYIDKTDSNRRKVRSTARSQSCCRKPIACT